MTAPRCALCLIKSLPPVRLGRCWPMPNSTASATTGISASNWALRASFPLSAARQVGKFMECVRKCALLSRPSAIGNVCMLKLSSARSNANSPAKRPVVRSPPNANKLFCSVWPTISIASGVSKLLRSNPAASNKQSSNLFNSASEVLGFFSVFILCNRFKTCCSHHQFFARYYRNFGDICVEHNLLRLRNCLVFEAIGIVFFHVWFYRFCLRVVPHTTHVPVQFVLRHSTQ